MSERPQWSIKNNNRNKQKKKKKRKKKEKNKTKKTKKQNKTKLPHDELKGDFLRPQRALTSAAVKSVMLLDIKSFNPIDQTNTFANSLDPDEKILKFFMFHNLCFEQK